MTPERFQQIRALFEAFVKRSPEQRESWLVAACRNDAELHSEVKKLVLSELDTAAALAAAPPTMRYEPQTRLSASTAPGRRVGAYELVRELGRGGMGTVWLAQRADDVFRKLVALKLMQGVGATAESRRRFQQEREILAALDHPHIARVLDGGTTEEGTPYLVMEYVAGEPIDRWCNTHKLNVAERLALFGQVCAAVQYAHQHSIVHRDLKPSNILVSAENGVKLLDFGIAKLLDESAVVATELTQTGQFPLTPEYASPEQVRGDKVTPATDVYALGVVLYELLTGRCPYALHSRIFNEIARVICEEEPARPSTALTRDGQTPRDAADGSTTPERISQLRETRPEELRRLLTGDLDNIVLKALRKEPSQRYGSAESLAEDLKRHTQGYPVLARPDSLLYRAGKLLRRNPLPFGAAAVLAVVTLSGAVTFHWHALFLGAMFISCMGLYYLVHRLDWGSRLIAERHMPFQAVFLLVCFSAVLLFLTWIPRANWDSVLTKSSLTILAFAAFHLLRWPWRARWAGPLLIDLSRRQGKGQLLLMGLALLSVLVLVSLRFKGAPIATYQWLQSVISIYVLLCNGRVELRGRGIVSIGALVPWTRVEGYRWEPGESGWVVLRVRVRKWFRFSVPWQWIVPANRKEQVEAVLSRQLSEWH